MKSSIFTTARERLLSEKERWEGDKLNSDMKELESCLYKVVIELREDLVTSWVAETGLMPSDSVIVSGPLKDGKLGWWIESKVGHGINHR